MGGFAAELWRYAPPLLLDLSNTSMPAWSVRIEPLPGYTPAIGRLVGMLGYARESTLAAVEGSSATELDHLHDDRANSIGALLAHIAVSERGYQCLTFEDRASTADE